MFWLIVCVILIIILIYYFSRNQTQEVVVQGMIINVISHLKYKNQAIKIMFKCNERMIILLDHLRKKYKIGATDTEWQPLLSKSCVEHKIISHLLRDFNYENIYENKPINGQDVAYSMNKGSTIMLCLRDLEDKGQVVDIDTLMFVIMHEAAHIANYNKWGHGMRFWSIFKYLLIEARETGIYNPIDYSKYPVSYCGFAITHNPYFDSNIEPLL